MQVDFIFNLQSLTAILQQIGWEKASCDDSVPGFAFEYSGKKPIKASPVESEGHGWIARVEGNCKVSIYNVMVVSCCCTCSMPTQTVYNLYY